MDSEGIVFFLVAWGVGSNMGETWKEWESVGEEWRSVGEV